MSKEREAASGAVEGARRATGGAPEERRDGRGRTVAECRQNLADAIALILEDRREGARDAGKNQTQAIS